MSLFDAVSARINVHAELSIGAFGFCFLLRLKEVRGFALKERKASSKPQIPHEVQPVVSLSQKPER
jgi:hypothetical protein